MGTLTVSQERFHISVVQSATTQVAESLEVLTRTFHPILKHLSKKYAPNPSYQADLYQEGAIGLIDAIKKFDLSSGYRLSTYVFHRIRGCMQDWLRKELRHPVSDVMEDTDSVESDSPETAHDRQESSILGASAENLPDSSPNPEELYHRQEAAVMVLSALMTLPPRQRQVVYLAFWKDYRPAEIADTLKISRPRVTVLISAGLRGLERKVQLAA